MIRKDRNGYHHRNAGTGINANTIRQNEKEVIVKQNLKRATRHGYIKNALIQKYDIQSILLMRVGISSNNLP
jgi:hypothetical protein